MPEIPAPSFRQVLRNRKARCGLAAFVIGCSLELLSLGLAVAGVVNVPLGWTLAGMGILGILVGIFLFISGRGNIYRDMLISEKGSEIKRISETLTLMHQRIKQLRAELAKQDIGREKAARLQEKMHKVSPFPPIMREAVHILQESGHEKLFIWLVERLHKRYVGSAYGSKYENFICNIGGTLETEGVGLKPVLSTDSEYKQLKDKLVMQYAGTPRRTGISERVLKYGRYLYGISSTILWNNYRISYLGQQLPVRVEARVAQFDPHAEDTIMNKFKEDVINAINKYIG